MAFKLGIENLLQDLPKKPIAMLTNASGVTQDLIQNIDLMKQKGAQIRKIFAPEHGIYAENTITSPCFFKISIDDCFVSVKTFSVVDVIPKSSCKSMILIEQGIPIRYLKPLYE